MAQIPELYKKSMANFIFRVQHEIPPEMACSKGWHDVLLHIFITVTLLLFHIDVLGIHSR